MLHKINAGKRSSAGDRSQERCDAHCHGESTEYKGVLGFALLGHVFLVRDSSVVNMNTRFLMKGGLCSEATGHAPAIADRLICSAGGVMAPAGGHKIQGSL